MNIKGKINTDDDYSVFLIHIVLSGFFMVPVLIAPVQAQQFDLLLDGGHVIDPKNNINGPRDVAISGDSIVAVSANLSPSEATQVVDVSGLYITPGLIDIHTHNYYGTEPHAEYSNGFKALPPDGFTFRAGVTTVVDAGGSGWRNFTHFKEQVIDRSQTRILAFLNIVGRGMKGEIIEQNNNDMDPKMTALMARNNTEIVGIKIAHYWGNDRYFSSDIWEPYRLAVKAGEKGGNIPVMVDFGRADSDQSLNYLLLKVLRPGDIYTHAFGGTKSGGRQAVINENDKLRDGMLKAQRRGIIFDVGHGGGAFSYRLAVPAIEQGLRPNTISTDLHAGSMNDGMKNMLNVIAKFLNLGMTIQEVVEASTWKPAQVIQREDIGHLSEGAVADIAVLDHLKGEFGFVDARGRGMRGTQKLEAELTIRAGEVVWDLNGLTAEMWNE